MVRISKGNSQSAGTAERAVSNEDTQKAIKANEKYTGSTGRLNSGLLTMRRSKVCKKDAPAICILSGGLLLLLSVIPLYGWRLDLARPSELRRISGQIKTLDTMNRPKAGTKLHIYVSSLEGDRHLTLDDLTCVVSSLLTFRPGDMVDALVKPDSFGRDLYWLWDLRRGDEAILTYDQSLHFLMQGAERVRPIGHALAVVASLLLIVGALLRRHFGAWSSSRKDAVGQGGLQSPFDREAKASPTL